LLTVPLLFHPTIPSIQATRPVVLCVEDDPAQLLMLHKILSLEGFQVLQAATAEEALEIFREAPVSLVFADHMLRGASGSQMARQLKALKPTVPILLHSGNSPDTLQHIDAFISKGEPVKHFLEVVRQLVARFSS
jgi:CheY-like chemotaxis protein